MRRGDIVTVAGGVYASKPRPALVIQDDRFDATDSVTVCPFTTTLVDAPLLRLDVAANAENGLAQDSFLMIDKSPRCDEVTPTQSSAGFPPPRWSSSNVDCSCSSDLAVDRLTNDAFLWRPVTAERRILLIAAEP